ncbi:ABC transporter permease [Alphaproteobacteria bacterium]|jgi:peptide/nickel transport system permease protein|nr:ABC transporter permease [Alphaproteobacteria bacterium]
MKNKFPKLHAALFRSVQSIPVLIGVVIISFVLTRALPGDPAVYFAGAAADEQSINEIRIAMGLDKTLYEQFFVYVKNLMQGNLGTSLSTGQPVLSDLTKRLPASIELTILSLILSSLISIPLGILAATRPDSWIDHLCRFLVTAGVSLPTFFTGILLIYMFYYILGLSPSPIGRLDFIYIEPDLVTGFYLIDAAISNDWETWIGATKQLILPSVTLALFTLAPIARMTRASMLTILSSEFVRTAKAAGLSNGKVLFSYALRNALLPIITTLGMVFSFALGANVLVEKVFAWPGIGSYAVEALIVSDYAAVQGFVLSMAIMFVILNLLIDLIYMIIDPRIGFESK